MFQYKKSQLSQTSGGEYNCQKILTNSLQPKEAHLQAPTTSQEWASKITQIKVEVLTYHKAEEVPAKRMKI